MIDRRELLLGASALAFSPPCPPAPSGRIRRSRKPCWPRWPRNCSPIIRKMRPGSASTSAPAPPSKSRLSRPSPAGPAGHCAAGGERLARLRAIDPATLDPGRANRSRRRPHRRTKSRSRASPSLRRRGGAQPELVLSQRALCRRPEYRRVRRDSRPARQQPQGRECGRRRGLSGPPRSLCGGAGRRNRPPRP